MLRIVDDIDEAAHLRMTIFSNLPFPVENHQSYPVFQAMFAEEKYLKAT